MNLWFAIYVQARHEKSVVSILHIKGYETCLPVVRSKREWSDRDKWLDVPAFPGYVFCRFEAERRSPILATPGVVSVVGSRQAPIAVEPEEMDSLLKLERAKHNAQAWPYLETGEKVRIEGGSLHGLTGILADCSKPARVVVSVSLLQRSVAVEVDRARVSPVSTSRRELLQADLPPMEPVPEAV